MIVSKNPFITPYRVWIDSLSKRYIRRHCPKDASILDVGCGRGEYVEFFNLNRIKGKYLGIDIEASDDWKDRKGDLDISFRKMDATAMKISEKHDFLFSNNCIEHIKKDEKALSEMFRVSKKGTKGVILVPSNYYWIFQLGMHGHHHYSRQELLGKIRKAGFRIVKHRGIGGLFSFSFMFLDSLLTNLILFPVFAYYKMTGKRWRSDIPLRIIGNSIHSYLKVDAFYRCHMHLMNLITKLDRLLPILPAGRIVVFRKP